jgi:hypothetical protein
MKKSKYVVKKLIREGEYVAEVDVALEYLDDAWSPYLSMQEADKLDRVRVALRRGDLQAAAQDVRVFKLHPC